MDTYTAIIEKDEDMYVATCPEIGTASQGTTVEEALTNLQEATELYLEEFPQKQKIKAFLTTFQVTREANVSA